MSLKPLLAAVLVLLLLASSVEAGLSAPTTNSFGYRIWGKYWDLMGENGLRNGTLGGVGNNVTFLDGSGVNLSAGGVTQSQVNNTINWYLPGVSNPTIHTFSTINNISLISTDNLSTYTERDTANYITVTDTRAQLTGVQGQPINVYKNVSETGNFEYVFEFYASSLTPSSVALMYFSNTTSNPLTTANWGASGIGTGFGISWTSEHLFRLIKFVGNTGSDTGVTNIPFLIGSKYYMKLNRTGTTLRLNVYSDPGKTTEIAGSPLSYTVSGDTFTVISLTAVVTDYTDGVQSIYIQNFGENLVTNTTFNPISNNSNTYYKSIRLNITNTTNQFVNVSIYGNADNYQTPLSTSNFTISQQAPRIVFYRTYNTNPLVDYSTVLTAATQSQTEYNMTVAGGMPPLSGGEHGTILATEVGVGSILQVEQSKLGTFADTALLTEVDYNIDNSNKTATNITLTSGTGVVAGTSKLRVSWLADIMNANSTSPNTAITIRVNGTRNNMAAAFPELLPVASGKYVEFIRSW